MIKAIFTCDWCHSEVHSSNLEYRKEDKRFCLPSTWFTTERSQYTLLFCSQECKEKFEEVVQALKGII